VVERGNDLKKSDMPDNSPTHFTKVRAIATLVLGKDGSYSPSAALSSPSDRAEFLKFHRGASAILIGGQTARQEPYKILNAPLYVVSKKVISKSEPLPDYLLNNPQVIFWEKSPAVGLRDLKAQIQSEIDLKSKAKLSIEKFANPSHVASINPYIAIEGGPYFLLSILKTAPELLDEVRITWVDHPVQEHADLAEADGKVELAQNAPAQPTQSLNALLREPNLKKLSEKELNELRRLVVRVGTAS
jgi:hypothetical protein